MKKQILSLLILIFFNKIVYSQIGLNTPNPQAVFHIDGNKDNPSTGFPGNAQQLNDFVVTQQGSVGIGVISPKKTLDIDAKNDGLMFRNLKNKAFDSYDIITRDPSSGEVVSTTYSYSTEFSLAANGSKIITLPSGLNITSGYIIVQSSNPCSRFMISTFVFNSPALAFISGVARDKIANAEILPIPANGGIAKSGTWKITFPGTLACAFNGSSTQFDYTLTKNTDTEYEIIYNGDSENPRTYKVTFIRL